MTEQKDTDAGSASGGAGEPGKNWPFFLAAAAGGGVYGVGMIVILRNQLARSGVQA